MRLDSSPPKSGDGASTTRRNRGWPGNIELLDRIIRIAIGAGLLAAALVFSGAWRWLGLVGVLPLLSGLVGWCPVYAWLMRD
ncbi:MAG TPA: YgaP-like transmembrane domain [Burkholderiales bacterium]|nr:YgaP-like transmembrane domain [Burkholderiales bacterium]